MTKSRQIRDDCFDCGRAECREAHLELIDSVTIDRPDGVRRLELLCGDLADTAEQFATDVLVVSAFPNDYTPTRSSLVGQLYWKGLSVADLAADKYSDLRSVFSCWLSKELVPKAGLPFRRLLCFEPATRGRAPELVSDIFRAIDPYTLGPPFLTSVMVPFVATGDQRYGIDEIGRALIEAAWHRLNAGHPFRTIRLAARGAVQANAVRPFFSEIVKAQASKQDVGRSARPAVTERAHIPADESDRSKADVFISYSRVDREAARSMSAHLRDAGISVFIDEQSIDLGASWQSAIFDAIETCKCVVVLYSPDFLLSRVCKDEFSAAMILRRRKGSEFIYPILVRKTDLPAYMEMLNYVDCCVSDPHKILAASKKVVAALS